MILKNFHLYIIILCLIYSCKKYKGEARDSYSFKVGLTNNKIISIKIEDLVVDSTLNVRAIEVKDGSIWFAGADGYFGRQIIEGSVLDDSISNIFVDSMTHMHSYETFLARKMMNDTLGYPQRGIAKIDGAMLTLTVGSPAIITKYIENSRIETYREIGEKVFYDSMDFWNDQEGIAIGDPTDDCISIIITRDGGNSWTKLDCSELPKAKEGEAAFAASDTNIAIVGDHTWVATGGMVSRILYSPDKGETWEVFDTPIIQGKPTTGMYSIDFYNEKNGFAIGGDYTDPEGNTVNKIRTKDGGRTWTVVADGQDPSYRSCVQYVPNSKAEELVAIGFKGIDYSNDSGDTWKHLSDKGFYTLRFLNDSVAFAAGNGRISKLNFRR